jgi:argininosuccinate lyase
MPSEKRSKSASKLKSTNLWGGRFEKASSRVFTDLNSSFPFDYRLLPFDIEGSIVFAKALCRARVLKSHELRKLKNALESIEQECAHNPSLLQASLSQYEDVHSFVETKLIAKVGALGKKIHAGRSRNDQVALDFRLYLRHHILGLRKELWKLMAVLVTRAEKHRTVVLPGYTHLQRAQPILLSHYWLAYFEMLARDRGRLDKALQSAEVMPLGSGALAGSGFNLDRDFLARELGFPLISNNSLDAVSDRDFALEFLSTGAILMVHLSRLAEDLILYSTREFDFVELSDTVTSGSSIMPQKKNPDALELTRGKAGRVFGNLQRLLTTLKGLPMAYNKDLQEDKEAVFDTMETLRLVLPAVTEVVQTLQIKGENMRQAAQSGYLNATECADYLVRKGLPFREAHEIVGKLVLRAIEQHEPLERLPVSQFQSFSPLFGFDIFEALSLKSTVESKSLKGGTSPTAVRRALQDARHYLKTTR